MNAHGWYSGTDTTGKVPTAIQTVMGNLDRQVAGPKDKVELECCLGIEADDNWRGFLLGLSGLVLLRIGDTTLARESLLEAIELFDVMGDNFEDVSNVHCQCCYSLGTLFFDDGSIEVALGYFLRCLARMHEVYDELFIGNIFLFLDLCMNAKGDFRTAVAFSENAVVVTGGDVDALESLMISQYNAGLLGDAKSTYHRILKKCDALDTRDRVQEFANRNLL